jgi:2-octaprenyl-6-methoxyphenol hydroxylase
VTDTGFVGTMSEREHDLVIVGGGPVGAALTIALSDGGYDVLLLEARPELGAASDGRTLAMSYGSRLILARLGAWKRVEPATPIHSIHISQRGGFGRALLAAEDAGLPALGYVVGYARLQKALGEALASNRATLAAGASVDDLEFSADRVAIRFRRGDQEHCVRARLLVIADGGASLEKRAGASIRFATTSRTPSSQPSQPRDRTANAHSSASPPTVRWPCCRSKTVMRWSGPRRREAAARCTEMNDKSFLRRLPDALRRPRQALPVRRSAHPVSARAQVRRQSCPCAQRAARQCRPGAAPIAGQGFNRLARCVGTCRPAAAREDRDPGSAACLAAYRSARRLDRLGGIAVTDSLVRIFPTISRLCARRAAPRCALDSAPPFKRAFIHRMIFGASL